jgi:transcriptional regulator with XRE-family HTH domain
MAISYLSALERVERTPSIDTLTRIAAGYGMTIQELLGPVGSELKSNPASHSDSLEAVAKRRGLTNAEKEGLLQLQYRGRRPETEDEWEAILSVLSVLPDRNQGKSE